MMIFVRGLTALYLLAVLTACASGLKPEQERAQERAMAKARGAAAGAGAGAERGAQVVRA